MKLAKATPEAIADAVAALRRGDLVAFPTETVYGLGADATNARAVAAIFEAKGRPRFNPLIVHVADVAAAERLGRLTALGRRLADAFWPGPLTLVLEQAAGLPDRRSGHGRACRRLRVRVPAHAIAQRLLAEAGVPVAAPSANRSGHVSPTTAAHVAADLGRQRCHHPGRRTDGCRPGIDGGRRHRRGARHSAPRRRLAREHRRGAWVRRSR